MQAPPHARRFWSDQCVPDAWALAPPEPLALADRDRPEARLALAEPAADPAAEDEAVRPVDFRAVVAAFPDPEAEAPERLTPAAEVAPPEP